MPPNKLYTQLKELPATNLAALSNDDVFFVNVSGIDSKLPKSDLPQTDLTAVNSDITALQNSVATISRAVNPKDYGAIGDGLGHVLTNADVIAHPEWRDTYVVGTDQLDYIGLQEAIYAAFGGPTGAGGIGTAPGWHSTEKSHLNRPVHIPAGNYIINKQLDMKDVYGFYVYGDARNSTTITQTSVDTPCLYMDGVSYGTMERIAFTASALSVNALVELDYTAAFVSLRPQQISIRDCTFSGAFLVDTGLRFCKSGSGAQGDTIIVENCFAAYCMLGGYGIGVLNKTPPYKTAGLFAFNALSIQFINGDIQGCPIYGIYCMAGCFFVDGTSCQNQNLRGAYFEDQVRNQGADFYQNGNGGFPSVIRNVRSESAILSDGIWVIENCEINGGTTYDWSPNLSGWGVGQIIAADRNIPNPGRTYYITQAGTTGATAPDWPNIGRCYLGVAVNITAGSTTVTGFAPNYEVTVGMKIVINGAGAGGVDHIATITDVTDRAIGQYTIDVAAVTTVTGREARIGPEITNGTVKFIPYDYFAIKGARTITGHTAINYGLIEPPNHISGYFIHSRSDWLQQYGSSFAPMSGDAAAGADVGKSNIIDYSGITVGAGRAINGGVVYDPFERFILAPDSLRTVPLAKTHHLFSGGPLLFVGGHNNGLSYSVGISRGYGDNALGSNSQVNNSLRVYGGVQLDTITFAKLAVAVQNGVLWYVTDGTKLSDPLTGGGTGCVAVRENGIWRSL